MIPIELSSTQQTLMRAVRDLAHLNFAPRARVYDHEAVFPAEDFTDLFRAGLLAPVVPPEYGGLGLGPRRKHKCWSKYVMTTMSIMKDEARVATVDLSQAVPEFCAKNGEDPDCRKIPQPNPPQLQKSQ